jgi:acetyltransferase-like isoleucine patch superfamily enzyme
MSIPGDRASEDPLFLIPRIVSRLYTQWMVWTYPFSSIGRGFSAQSSCQLRRSSAPYIKIGDGVRLDRDVWLNIPFMPECDEPVLLLDDGCAVGRNCIMSAQNLIHVGRNTIFGPSVLLMDHGLELESGPFVDQRKKGGGTIRIEEGCWLGFRSAIVCTEGELIIGKNSVIGANCVVSRSIPPFSVVAGNPGRVVKHYEPSKGIWVLGSNVIQDRG